MFWIVYISIVILEAFCGQVVMADMTCVSGCITGFANGYQAMTANGSDYNYADTFNPDVNYDTFVSFSNKLCGLYDTMKSCINNTCQDNMFPTLRYFVSLELFCSSKPILLPLLPCAFNVSASGACAAEHAASVAAANAFSGNLTQLSQVLRSDPAAMATFKALLGNVCTRTKAHVTCIKPRIEAACGTKLCEILLDMFIATINDIENAVTSMGTPISALVPDDCLTIFGNNRRR